MRVYLKDKRFTDIGPVTHTKQSGETVVFYASNRAVYAVTVRDLDYALEMPKESE